MMIEHFQTDVRRINHALKVFDFARIISEQSLDKKTKEIYKLQLFFMTLALKRKKRNTTPQ